MVLGLLICPGRDELAFCELAPINLLDSGGESGRLAPERSLMKSVESDDDSAFIYRS